MNKVTMRTKHKIAQMFEDAIEAGPLHVNQWAVEQAQRVLDLIAEETTENVFGFKVIQDETVPPNEIHIRYHK